MKQGELLAKKSKFISFLYNIDCERSVQEILSDLKIKYKKATHICYAYKICQNKIELVKFSDDNEPNGSAGRPILNVIEKSKLKNVLVVVIRYFGGIKLGVGGLFRAYTKSASIVCEMEKNESLSN